MTTHATVEPCPHCGAELYDRVVLDQTSGHDEGVCWSCKGCVSLDCPDHGAALQAMVPDEPEDQP